MEDKKEIREISLEEEKDITGGMGIKSENIITPTMLAYGFPGLPCKPLETTKTLRLEELVPDDSIDSKPDSK